MEIKNKNLKIAIQKSGKLTEASIQYLRSQGIEFEIKGSNYTCDSNTDNSQIILVRDDDIPFLVSEGYVDLGIIGKDVFAESGLQAKIFAELDFGFCSLKVAIPNKSNLNSISDLQGKIIATKYPRLVQVYLNKQRINARCIKLNGSLEMAPGLGIVDAIVDTVTTGNTLKANNLEAIATIFESNAILITNLNTL